jgi:hypothetical protein
MCNLFWIFLRASVRTSNIFSVVLKSRLHNALGRELRSSWQLTQDQIYLVGPSERPSVNDGNSKEHEQWRKLKTR